MLYFPALCSSCFAFTMIYITTGVVIAITIIIIWPWNRAKILVINLGTFSASINFFLEYFRAMSYLVRIYYMGQSMRPMQVWHSGQIAGFGIPCLFTKQICSNLGFKNDSANCAWDFKNLWDFDIKCCFSFTSPNLQLSDMQGSISVLPWIFSTFLPVSFLNSLSISFRRLSSFFFRCFFFVLSTFLSITVDWNLLPGR